MQQLIYFSILITSLIIIFALSERLMNYIHSKECHYFDFSRGENPKCEVCKKDFKQLYPEIK